MPLKNVRFFRLIRFEIEFCHLSNAVKEYKYHIRYAYSPNQSNAYDLKEWKIDILKYSIQRTDTSKNQKRKRCKDSDHRNHLRIHLFGHFLFVSSNSLLKFFIILSIWLLEHRILLACRRDTSGTTGPKSHASIRSLKQGLSCDTRNSAWRKYNIFCSLRLLIDFPSWLHRSIIYWAAITAEYIALWPPILCVFHVRYFYYNIMLRHFK